MGFFFFIVFVVMKILMKKETWNFAVIGCDSHGPKFLGITETYEGAAYIQQSAARLGWTQVAILDTALQEVKQKPASK